MKNFKLCNADTDSITICREDESYLSKEERTSLLKDLNDHSPKGLVWEDDGYYKMIIVLKAKNYILHKEDGKIIKKGSSLKSSTLEPALKEFLDSIINSLLNEEGHSALTNIYHKYVKEIDDIKDIKRWASKKAITGKTLSSERSNESKIRDAIVGTEYVEGDRIYLYFKNDDTLSLVENFDGDYNKERFYKKLHNATKRFETVLPVNDLFINYSLKKNKEALCSILK